MPSTEEQILSLIGSIVAYGGGSAAIAYLLFQYLGRSWIESKFAEKLELLRHTQALELQRLRVEIDAMLSGAIKIQDKEFEVLPEAWIRLDEAYGRLASLVSPIQEYPDLDRLGSEKLEEFLDKSKLHESDKAELRQSSQKTKIYQKTIFWYRCSDVRSAIIDFHNYVERNSIFMPPELKWQFEKASSELWSAMVSKEVGHDYQDWKMQDEGWDKIKKEIEPLRKNIQEAIYVRLQTHGKKISS
ncbi:MAG: hypothetical protein DU480_09675 [Nitrosomonas sp.]|uniref:hypothetical protein n=1 Tax=Nitrosomonas sp. TaxID=42353 RepID=UPI0032EAF8F2